MEYFADISNNNGKVHDVNIAAITGAALLCKASESANFTDQCRAAWQTISEAAGRPSGNYHFHRGAASPAAQLERWKRSGLGDGQLRPVIDAEDNSRRLSKTAMARSVLDLAELVAGDQGVEPVIYTGGWWIGDYCTRDPAFARYPLWLSAYPLGNTRSPSDDEAAQWFKVGKYCAPPAPWGDVFAWQFTSIARTPGVPGNCDRSVITADNLTAFHRSPHNAPMPHPIALKEDDMHILYQRGDGDDTQSFLLAGDKLVFQDAPEVYKLVAKGAVHVIDHVTDKSWNNLVHRLGDPDTV